VRPLPRRYKGCALPATEPDVYGDFAVTDEASGDEVKVRFQGWHGLVRADQKVAADNKTFTI
jgi:hypothetical protein